jgi:HAD superfamily hydrolase (TIGR01458 family)
MISALLIDLDGTVYSQGKAYPGAADAIQGLKDRGIPYRFITNTTMRNRWQLVERLWGMGIATDLEHMFIAPQAAAEYCLKQGYQRVWLVVANEAIAEEFEHVRLVDQGADAIVLGDLGAQFNHEILNQIFQEIMEGAQLIAMQKGRYWLTKEYGLTLDLGAYVAALEYATGREAVLVGKPSRDFFDLAVESLGMERERIAVVGDSLENDVAGAKRAGIKSILVKTGVFQEEELAQTEFHPEVIIPSLADVLTVIDTG